MSLLGRTEECTVLDGLLADIGRGESRSLILRGEAGIGKTALLEYLVDAAPDVTVVRAAGVESEMELPFASLHQLCASLLDRLPSLPEPQRQALQVVFGLDEGPAPDRFLVGLAVLSLFSEVAGERPLLCVVDDAQWLDQASALTLGFVARRLLADPVGLVFAARETDEELQHVDQLEIAGLPDEDARALLGAAVRFPLDERVRDRVIAETRGNPLALLELPRGMSPTQLAGGFGMPHAGDLSRRIEESFMRRVEALDGDARRLLLLAAAEPVGDPMVLARACEHLAVPLSAVDGTDGLLSVEERVTFRHPLARSAVYRIAAAADRRESHFALAEVTDPDAEPDRRAWHLAAAAAAPDEEVARELERSAERAKARGGLAAAIAFMRRSVALTNDPWRRAGRALDAAHLCMVAGAFALAEELLAAAAAGPLDEFGRARLDLLNAQLLSHQKPGGDTAVRMLAAAKRLETLDVRLCRDTYLETWSSALYAGRFAPPGGTFDEVCRAAASAPRAPDPPRATDLLLDGLVLLFTEGRRAAVPAIGRALAAFRSPELPDEQMVRWGWLATRAANIAWDYDSGLEIGRRAVQLARDTGTLEILGMADNALGQAAAVGGDFATATVVTAEVHAVREATESRIAPLAEVALAGLRGRLPGDQELIDGLIAFATAREVGAAAQYGGWARAVLMNGLGRHGEARAAAARVSEDTPELFLSMWATIELVEAATRTGNVDLATTAFARLEAQTEATDTGWALGVLARSRALVSEDADAEPAYREAIEHLTPTRLRPDLARAHLLYGEWLRRANRRADAREQLRTAHDLFDAIGMTAFAERSRRELRATGETVRGRTEETRDELTPQEQQIARLARDGLSNPEIAAQLFLSPRTVEWHLHKVFTKLGIRSRRGLAAALTAPPD